MRASTGPKRRWFTLLILRIPNFAFILALFCVATILCFLYPEYLTTPGIRSHYPIEFFRSMIFGCMWAALAISLASLVFLPEKSVPLLTLGLLLVAYALGGSQAPLKEEYDSFVVRMGLDLFLLDLFILGFVFIPLEAIFPLYKNQPIIRPEFRTDLTYFAVSHIGFQGIALITNYPVERWLQKYAGGTLLASYPLWLQILAGLILADLTQYAVHRVFHSSFLWRFHRVHHSTQAMDWLAGSRLHLVDILVTRGLVFAVLFVGISSAALPYVVLIIAFQTVWIHSNTRWGGGWLELVFVTPRIHHWHHADQKKAYNTNFAVQFSLIDRMFGTFRAPEKIWPGKYGLSTRVPEGYMQQFLWPFRRDAIDESALERSQTQSSDPEK